jgi:pSer/pThr/pTyr-binding forkhead associated (FHA) protein
VSNGTFVNGKRIPNGEDVEIYSGDEVRFGLVKTLISTGARKHV